MSKIPEGTQFIEAGCGENGFRKFEKGCWWFFEGFWRHVNWNMGALTLVTEHPDYAVPAATWTGEGLPPVGTVCEVFDCSNDYTKQFNGQKVEIVAHHLRGTIAVAVFAADNLRYHGVVEGHFRPIRTPEQIAAEEREAGITQMRELVGSLNTHPFSELWDAGYRKQVAP